MNYPPAYHAAVAAMISGRPKPETRRSIARALRWIRNNRGAAHAAAERRLFLFTAPQYFTR
jgi:hypothetical protein